MTGFPLITVARFWSKVEVPDAPHHLDLCWEWRGGLAKGYGQMKINGRVLRSHRIAYEMANGPAPDGAHILHSCDNPRCCNPRHLRAGTHADNMQDMAVRGRVWHGGPRGEAPMTRTLVLAALTLTACASTSWEETGDRIVLHHGYGGHLQSTEAVYEDIEATGKPVVIDGHLHSADAFYGLALPEVCYTPNASVSLHAISYLGLVPSAKHTGRMAERLPKPVEAWFRGSMAFYDPIGWAALDAGELSEIWPDGRC